MYKRALVLFSSLAILLLLLGSCTPSDEVAASLGQELTLHVGDTAVFQNDNLKIKFEAVTAESRCPTGVECIRAGEAKCNVLIGSDRSFSLFELVDVGGTNGYSAATFQNDKYHLSLSFRLEPYPQAGRQIDSSDYVLLLKVNKIS